MYPISSYIYIDCQPVENFKLLLIKTDPDESSQTLENTKRKQG